HKDKRDRNDYGAEYPRRPCYLFYGSDRTPRHAERRPWLITAASKRSVFIHRHHHAAAGTLHFHSSAARSAGCSRANRKDWIFDIDTSGFVEFQRSFDGLALFKWMLEVAEHDVEAPWRKRDGFSRLDFKAALYRAHFHNATFHRHTVNLALPA